MCFASSEVAECGALVSTLAGAALIRCAGEACAVSHVYDCVSLLVVQAPHSQCFLLKQADVAVLADEFLAIFTSDPALVCDLWRSCYHACYGRLRNTHEHDADVMASDVSSIAGSIAWRGKNRNIYAAEPMSMQAMFFDLLVCALKTREQRRQGSLRQWRTHACLGRVIEKVLGDLVAKRTLHLRNIESHVLDLQSHSDCAHTSQPAGLQAVLKLCDATPTCNRPTNLS